MTRKTDPDGARLPIKLDATSNGEFAPIPLDETSLCARRRAQEVAIANARRSGLDRRSFMVSACGAASTLLAFNEVFAAAGKTGGRYEIPAAAAVDPELARASIEGNEFIFDVQGHYVNPNGAWVRKGSGMVGALGGFPNAGCARAVEGDTGHLACFGPDEFVKDVFLDSDTDMMVLSFVPSTREAEPLTIEEASATRQIVERLDGAQRLMLHGRVNPNQDGDLQGMDELAERWNISAWKTYTQWGPDGKGFFLHDEQGTALVEKACALGVRNICVHKGIPFGRKSYEHSLCDDVGVIARRYPQVNFLIYHSGYIPGQAEGPYDPARGEGIDSLVRSVLDNGIKPNSNVYAELGSTWRMLMRDPDSAAHALGKLLRFIGPNNVLWGTDSIWYGSPQDQIQAFRTFQIAEELREGYGYPEITPQLRARVFGHNAAHVYGIGPKKIARLGKQDHIARMRADYRHEPDPAFLTYGPRTRREFLHLLRLTGGSVS